MATVKVLVPYNFSVHDFKAFDFIVNMLAGRRDAAVSIFNAYPPAPLIDLTSNPELSKMKGAFCFCPKNLRERGKALR